jgi:uncharacterized protein
LFSKAAVTREMIADKLTECHSKLLIARNTRIRPGTDDKILTSWNALMLATFASAARAFMGTQQGDEYLNVARRNAKFLLSELRPKGRLRRVWRRGSTTLEVFLEDYAAIILALLDLYQTDFDNKWFVYAAELTDEMMNLFNDSEWGFFDTPVDGESLLIRPKDIQDNATPCGNSLACDALLHMAALTDRSDFRQKAEEMLEKVSETAIRFPTGFARWLSAEDFALGNIKQIAVVGDLASQEHQSLLTILRDGYHPQWVLAASPLPLPENAPALLHDRPLVRGNPTAYVCESFMCKRPVTDAQALREQLN